MIGRRYRVDSLIQRGGMGDVYKGTDIETDAVVAIKTLNRAIVMEDPSLLERFRREADVLRRLDHPNIVRIFDTIDQDEEHHIVMEFIGGGSLATLLTGDGKLPVARSLQIGLDVADALTRAHRLNIIHRDIKPANILLTEAGAPRLTDFGVAQIGDRQTRLTRQGALLGTIAYLAPELAAGGPYSEKTDIWSFGIVLYEMLAGRHPFMGERPAEVVGAILNDPVPDLGRYRSDLPGGLQELVQRMLAKDPAQRVESVRAVGAALEHLNRQPSIYPVPEPQPTPTPTPPVEPQPVEEPATIPPPVPVADRELRVFVSYRHEDSAASSAAQIAARLQAELGRDRVFYDLQRIGLRTASRIVLASEVLANCTHLVAVIGPRWLADEHYNLGSPRDPVRVELETALKQPGMRIIPVLVDGAVQPRADMLPPALQPLAALKPITIGSGGIDAVWQDVLAALHGETKRARIFDWRIAAAAAVVALVVIVALLLLTRGG
jgi:serine/threonine protein kinase